MPRSKTQIYTVLSVLIALCGAVFWAVGVIGDSSPRPSAGLPMLNLTPAAYEAITTTVNTSPAEGVPAELRWHWQYDLQGRVTEVLGPGGAMTRIAYSQTKIDAEATPGKERRVLAYDAEGRLLTAQGPGGNVSVHYHKTGMPAEVRTDRAPVLRYQYDGLDRLIQTRIGEKTIISYRYDYLGRIAGMNTPAGTVTWRYHPAANTIIRRLPNGVQTVRRYDDEGKLASITHVDAKQQVVAEYAYAYRPDGLIDRIAERNQRDGGRDCRYTYDLMQRVTAVACQGGGHSYAYVYDSIGNVEEVRVGENELLRFTSAPTGALTSDSRGSSAVDARGHIRLLPGDRGPVDYEFNTSGDLAAAREGSVRYAYNALGLLMTRSVQGRETRYLPDPFADAWQPLWRRNADGSESAIVWDGDTPLMEIRGSEVLYRLEDHAGSVRVELNKSGNVAAWRDYSPYGLPATSDGDLTPGFAGLFWDPAARVYLTMARAYDPVTGRFLQPDPTLRVPDESTHSHSLYSYCGGDPVNFVDRNGAEAVSNVQTAAREFAEAFGSAIRKAVDYADAMSRIGAERLRAAGRRIKEDYHKKFPPLAREQQKDFKGDYREWLVDTLNAYEAQAFRELSSKRDWDRLTPTDKRKSARKRAVDKFAHEFSAHPFRPAMPNKEEQAFDKHLGNKQVWTRYGWASGDWLTTVIDTKNRVWFLPKSHEKRYRFEKTIHNSVSPWLLFPYNGKVRTIKEFPEEGNEYPETDLNAVRAINDLYDPDQPFEKIFPHFDESNGAGSSNTQSEADELSRLIISQIQKLERIRGHYDLTGGNGRVAGPGGFASPEAYEALEAWQSRDRSSPSRVGGVYLAGAGKALEGLGQLKGVAIDKNTGRLVLIGSDERAIGLPPLRLDDVVTVFRAVYDHGESPSVTIDPDPKNPTGPLMHVKHGPGTEGTYVGWVLFECDRIMKTYQLGQDNVTRDALSTRVPGHPEVLEKVFFGDRMHETGPGSIWERFWIVPAAVRRFDLASTNLSLVEIPLKVNTQRMRWQNGELVDDEKGQSSAGATAFSQWFTTHYGGIADEVYLTPPAETAVYGRVPIFHELQRIALIAAIAERLRDLGERLPPWMRDYRVAPFPTPDTTPSLTREGHAREGSVLQTASIYGGVNLAPADKDVHAYIEAKDSRPEDKVFLGTSMEVAAFLAPRLPDLVRAHDSSGVVVRPPNGRDAIAATVLPGANTLALMPNRQQVTDIEVPAGLGRTIGLTRYYNSLFDPSGEFGRAWTLDLPRLVTTRVPVSRDGKRSQYRVVHHLTTPLGSLDVRFARTERVEPWGALMIPDSNSQIAGLGSADAPIVGAKTVQVIFRDGTIWHFDDAGRLVLEQFEGAAIRYVRDLHGMVRQIVGYAGRSPVAEIRLAYDTLGRIVQADARQALYEARASEVRFEYDAAGRLAAAVRPAQQRREDYTWEAGLLSRIAGRQSNVSFRYNHRAQLRWEKQGDRIREYSFSTVPQATTVSVDGSSDARKWIYDERMRPVQMDLGDGRIVLRQYGKDNEISEIVSQSGSPLFTRMVNQIGNMVRITWRDGPTFELRRDAGGRPASVTRDGVPVWQAHWRRDGPLDALRIGDTEVRPRHHTEGWVKGVLISAPMEAGKTGEWVEAEWDLRGQLQKFTDSSGFRYVLNYDGQGRVIAYGRITEDGKLAGATVTYDGSGLATGISSSWGTERREYADGGVLKSVVVERSGAKSVSTFDSRGRPTMRADFDGGVTKWVYNSNEAGTDPTEIVLPSGRHIAFQSNSSTTEIDAGPALITAVTGPDGRISTMSWGSNRTRR
jgi:RHS repeat-associated protein